MSVRIIEPSIIPPLPASWHHGPSGPIIPASCSSDVPSCLCSASDSPPSVVIHQMLHCFYWSLCSKKKVSQYLGWETMTLSSTFCSFVPSWGSLPTFIKNFVFEEAYFSPPNPENTMPFWNYHEHHTVVLVAMMIGFFFHRDGSKHELWLYNYFTFDNSLLLSKTKFPVVQR